MSKGIVATVSDDNITIHQQNTPYGVMQDAMGSILRKGINMIAVRLLDEDARNTLKERFLFSDGETAFIESPILTMDERESI